MSAEAIPVNITVDSAGKLLNLTGVANKTQYGQQNNNPTSNLSFLNKEIGFWDGAFNPDLPSASGLVELSDETLSGSTYSASAGYDYVVFHFGAGRAGSPGGWWQAFYLGGTEGSFTVPTVGGRSVGDFSSARFYNPVPDSGSTVMLLGTALLVLGVASRRFATR